MKLKTKKFEIETNNIGQISSMIFEETELLHDGKNWWDKIFPIVWPVIGISNDFEVNGKNHVIPKHGFMKDLKWEGYVIQNKITLMSTFIKNEIYPYSIDINIRIWAEENTAFIETKFTNISTQEAYFHFGYHPAFKIDSTSKIKGPDTQAIDLNGKLTNKLVKHETLMDMKFGIEYDTLVNKNIDFNKVEYNYKELNIEVMFDSPNVQFWKPQNAMFICIEPWWGSNDSEKELISKAKDKEGIIKLISGESWKGTMSVKISQLK